MIDVDDALREVTEAEIAHYDEFGWAKLDGLVTPEFVATMRQVAFEPRAGVARAGSWEAMALNPAAEPFHSFFFSRRMSTNAARLVNRRKLTDVTVPLRYRADHLVKRDPGAEFSHYHQDSAEHGSDRAGELQFWLALDEVTPDMGPMRFLSGSHRAGPLGSVLRSGEPDLLESYPKLVDLYPMSDPFHYQPGDCTVHHGFTVHGTAANTGDRPRLSYIFSYTPADTRWHHGKVGNWTSSETELLPDATNPIAYPPAVDA